MTPRLIHAHFNGKCKVCGKAVAKGDSIYFAKHYGVRCMDCGPHTSEDQPTPSRYKGHKRKGKGKGEQYTAAAGGVGHRDADGVFRTEFGSIGEAVTDALADYAQNDHNQQVIRERQEKALTGRNGWGNYFTKDRLLAEIGNPSEELTAAVAKMRERLTAELPAPTSPRRRIRRGVEDGEELNVDRWAERDPMCWDRNVREPRPSGVVRIACNLSVSWAVRPSQLLYRGAAALALADLLTGRGYNVEIVAFDATSDPTEAVSNAVARYVIKRADMPLDLGACTFAMCEVAFTRVIGFCGSYRHLPGKIIPGWGGVRGLPAADRKGFDYVIDSNVLSESAAAEWLLAASNSNNEKEVSHV